MSTPTLAIARGGGDADGRRHMSDRARQSDVSANKRECLPGGGLDARPPGTRGRFLIGQELALKFFESLLCIRV